MKRWWLPVTILYGLLLAFLVLPIAALIGDPAAFDEFPVDIIFARDIWADSMWQMTGVWLVVLIAIQLFLLFGSVKTGFVRRAGQRPARSTLLGIALACGLMAALSLWSIGVAIWGDEALRPFGEQVIWSVWATVFVLWIVWFFVFRRFTPSTLKALFGASILHLLVVVPCHIVVRNREDCCAPIVTAFGIATGIAIMLLAFGPAIAYLYRKQMESYYAKRRSPSPPRDDCIGNS